MKISSNHEWGILKLSIAVLFVLFFAFQSASAVTDYMFFSVNGDTSRTSIVQGDQVSWGANCDIGAMLTWDIWVDLNMNAVIDSSSDRLVATFDIADGDTSTDGPPPDINPIPDGWYITPQMTLGVAPGLYIFKARNHVDNSSVQRSLISTALPSPPNMFRGRVTVAGHPAPDSIYLRNIWIEAGDDNGSGQMWSALTDDYGLYQINVSAQGSGLQFHIKPCDIPGFVTPGSQIRVASGIIDSINFAYVAPTDSLYGEIRDGFGALITMPIGGQCSPRFSGPGQKEFTSLNGAYSIYFGPSEYGTWNLNLNGSALIPTYLCPSGFEFDNSINHSQNHNFVCYNADAMIYGRVTEQGNNPAHHYMVVAQSGNLQALTYAISGTGDTNLVALHISSMDQNNWNVTITEWDNHFPIPPGYILDQSDNYWNRHPGDTISLNFVFGEMVRDTLKLDPGDPGINWNETSVNLLSDGSSYNAQIDNNGVFTMYADTGTYMMNANHDGYLCSPTNRTVHIVSDTSGGLGFTFNEAHCVVYGTLMNVPLPLTVPVNIFAHTGNDGNGYSAWDNIDFASGAFVLRLCDGDWTIDPPSITDMISPQPEHLTISERPDTLRSVNLIYEFMGVNGANNSLPAAFTLNQNYPNPFNAQTLIEYGLPKASHVIIEIYDILGRKVKTLQSGRQEAGFYKITWNATDQPSGIYFYGIKTDDFAQMRKMLLLK